MHALLFDIDGTLLDSNGVDGELYITAVRCVLSDVRIRESWGCYRHVTDAGILDEILSDNGIANDERTRPSTIGRNHLSFCAGVPASASRFMLPSSGAAQLNASGPKIERLASSYIAAQPTTGSPMPP